MKANPSSGEIAMRSRLTSALAAIAVTVSGVVSTSARAEPAKPCLHAQEIKGFVGYVLPDIVGIVVTRCGPALRADGYINTRGSLLAQRLAVGKEAAWPMARQAFGKLGGEFKGQARAGLSDRTIRSLIDNEMVTKLAADLPLAMCGDIEAIAAPLDPLPAANTVEFLSAIFGVAGRKGSDMRACAAS